MVYFIFKYETFIGILRFAFKMIFPSVCRKNKQLEITNYNQFNYAIFYSFFLGKKITVNHKLQCFSATILHQCCKSALQCCIRIVDLMDHVYTLKCLLIFTPQMKSHTRQRDAKCKTNTPPTSHRYWLSKTRVSFLGVSLERRADKEALLTEPRLSLAKPSHTHTITSTFIITELSFCLCQNLHFKVMTNICDMWSVICSYWACLCNVLFLRTI